MTRLFRALALLVAIACFVWIGVLWQWQRTQRDMSVEDIGLYLVALPLTVFALVVVGRWAWRGAMAGAAANAPVSAETTVAAPPASTEDAAAVHAQVLAAQVHCAAGNDPRAVLAALADGQPRPALDVELRDDEGLPLMTARIAALDVATIETEPHALTLRGRSPAWEHAEMRPQARRALAALAVPLEAALAELLPWRPAFQLADPSEAARQGAGGDASRSMLRLLALWPADWTDYETALAHEWLMARLEQADLAAPERIVPVARAGLPGGAWVEAEQLLQALDREGRADVLLVTACHSAIDDDCVRRLQAEGRLFTSRTPKLPIAGEGAAVMALAPAGWPTPGDIAAAPVRLHRAGWGTRDKPIDAAGRTAAQVSEACIEQALAASALAASDIAAAVHDADQHTARSAEALAALTKHLPHLDVAADVHQSGALNGQLGVVAPWFVAALAVRLAQAAEKPCLALTVDDALLRVALVARPAPIAAVPAA